MRLLKGLLFIFLIPFLFVFSLLRCVLTVLFECVLFVIVGDDYDKIPLFRFIDKIYFRIFDFWFGLLSSNSDK